MVEINIKYTPTERQQQAHEAPQRYKLFGGAMGGGKSYWLCASVVGLMLEYPGNRALLARYHLSDFKNTTLKSLFELIPDGMLEDNAHNKSEHTIKLSNGSEILYMGLSEETDVNKLKSMEIGVFAFDEASEIPQEQFDLASTRLRIKLTDGTRPRYFGLLTSNPEDCWLKDRFIKGKVDEERYVFIPSLPRDNPYLPDDYEDNMRKDLPEEWVRRYLEGSWDDLTFGNFVISGDLVSRAIDKGIPKNGNMCLGVDVAKGVGGDETAMYVGDGGSVIDYNYNTEEKITESNLRAQKFIMQYGVEATCVDDIGIGAGVTDFLQNFLKIGGVEGINVGCKSEDNRFFNLRAEIWWNARKMFEDGKVSIPNDAKLVRQLSAVKYKIRNTGKVMLELKEETKRRIGQSPDRADALVLMLWAARNYTATKSDYPRDEDKTENGNPYGWDDFYRR